MNMYLRFGAMVATSTVAMFGLMYLNTYELAHVSYSETRTYMALVMGATMAIIMLGFMTHMLKDWRVNIGIVAASAILFSLALWLVRSQTTVQDISYMKAMIPHHSIAIMTSERAEITDPRVRKLADKIIASQRREIAEMEALISDIKANGKQTAAQSGVSPKTAIEMLLGPKVPPPDPSAVNDVRFNPDGNALHIADSGSIVVKDKAMPAPGSGVIWRVVPETSQPAGPPANLSVAR